MKIQIFVLIALTLMLPVVTASIDTSFNFEGNGVLSSETQTLNDCSTLAANSKGLVHLTQNTHMAGLDGKSDMDFSSSYGGAHIKTPEYNLRMKGYNFSAGASLFRIQKETASSVFPKYDSEEGENTKISNDEGTHKAINNVLTTVIEGGVFVRGKGDNGSLDRRIQLRDGKRINTIAATTFRGQFNFSDSSTLSGIVIQKVLWQQEVNYPISEGDNP